MAAVCSERGSARESSWRSTRAAARSDCESQGGPGATNAPRVPAPPAPSPTPGAARSREARGARRKRVSTVALSPARCPRARPAAASRARAQRAASVSPPEPARAVDTRGLGGEEMLQRQVVYRDLTSIVPRCVTRRGVNTERFNANARKPPGVLFLRCSGRIRRHRDLEWKPGEFPGTELLAYIRYLVTRHGAPSV